MKMKKILSLLLCLGLLGALLAGCGGSSKAMMAGGSNYAMKNAAVEEAAAMDMAVAETSADRSLQEEGSDGAPALPENRKWIVTVNLYAETDDLDALTAALNKKISQLGGYVENQSIHNGSTYSNYRYRNANLTIRIPAQDVDKFTDDVGGIANVVSKSKNLEDITLTYVSTESRMKALQTEETRLLELLAKAETMSDLLEIEARLTDVRHELESTTSQMRLFDNQINYATIYLTIEEVQEYTPVEEPGFFERISKGFKNSLEGLGDGAVDVTVWIIANSPYLVVFGGLTVVILLIIRRARKGKAKKKAMKKEDQT